MMQALTVTDLFDALLLASPSSWYPGFVNMIERTPLACRPFTRIVLASRADEGAGEPEPICGIRQDTDRLVATLSARYIRTTRAPGKYLRSSMSWVTHMVVLFASSGTIAPITESLVEGSSPLSGSSNAMRS